MFPYLVISLFSENTYPNFLSISTIISPQNGFLLSKFSLWIYHTFNSKISSKPFFAQGHINGELHLSFPLSDRLRNVLLPPTSSLRYCWLNLLIIVLFFRRSFRIEANMTFFCFTPVIPCFSSGNRDFRHLGTVILMMIEVEKTAYFQKIILYTTYVSWKSYRFTIINRIYKIICYTWYLLDLVPSSARNLFFVTHNAIWKKTGNFSLFRNINSFRSQKSSSHARPACRFQLLDIMFY